MKTNHHIENLKSVLIETNVKSVEDGMNVLNGYFDKIGFSVVQHEWKHMSIAQRERLVKKLVSEITK